jgi:serine/threonine protein kinase/Flp pilus assembly protein TadD
MVASEPRLRELFSKAAECQTAKEQAAYLDQVCQGDEALRAQLDELLQAHREAGSFLHEPSAVRAETIDLPEPAERPGTVIGPYKLLQQIGEGGMGTVFMAEQSQPIQRKVALKIIKAGMDSRQVIARFEAERQALAVMDHVNIARVFDGGATEAGRPYFVMELVHGVPITKYCDDNHLTPRERLELFVPVCQAIQHAHQKGVIHRDIKPSNVMVTLYDGKAVPKVIDFGVAKATEQKLTERTLFTQYGTMVGTLEYMSPEQAEMSALGVDTRSDIYSLGVLLYELLTGSTPLTHKRMKEAAYAEILRMIKEEEPPKPSTRLSDSGEALASISAQRQMEPAKLTKLVRGELDWIVMKTLEKDRNRRYETAKDFAADVQRYLNDEPVQACPPSRWYRFCKFARRNKRALVTAAAAALIAVLGLVALAVSNVLIRQEQVRTQTANDRLKENLRVGLQVLDDVYLRLTQDRLGKNPQQLKEDDELFKKALTYYEQFAELNSNDPEVRREIGRAHTRAGNLHAALGQQAQAKQAHGRAVTVAEQLAADYPNDPEYRRNLAATLIEKAADLAKAGDRQGSDRPARRAFDLRKQLAAEFPGVVAYRQDLAFAHNMMGMKSRGRDPAAAAQHLRAAVDIQTRVVAEGLNTPSSRYYLARAHVNLGAALADLNEPEQLEHWRRAIPIYTELVDNAEKYRDLPREERLNPFMCRRDLATTHRNVARYLKTVGDPMAEKHLAQSVAIQNEVVADVPKVPQYRAELAYAHLDLGDLLLAGSRPADAEEHYRQAMGHLTRLVVGPAGVSEYRATIVVSDRGSGLGVFRHPAPGEYRDRLAFCHIHVGNLRSDAGDRLGAVEHYRQAFVLIEGLVREWPEEPNYVRSLAWNLATCLDPKFRDIARAVREAERLVKMPPVAVISWTTLGVAYYQAGDWKAAVDALERAVNLSGKQGDGMDWIFLAMAHWQLGNKEEARRWYDRSAKGIDQHAPNNEEVRRFHAEAAALLKIADRTKSKSESK